MIRMIGVFILIAREIILMTRMIAQICKKQSEKLRKQGAASGRAPLGRGRTLECVFYLHIWAIILVIRTIIWAARMISPITLNHPRVRQKPGCIDSVG